MTAVLLMFAFLVPGMALESLAQDSNGPVETSSQWLLSFKQSNAAYETYNNPRFLALLRQGLPHYAVPWYQARGQNLILPDGAAHAVSYPPSSVMVESDRFVTIIGTIPREGNFKGLLWCDTGAEYPTMIFVFMNQHLGVGKSDSGSLDIYTNSKGADSPLPPQFVASVLSWEKETKVTKITGITVHDAEDQSGTLPVSTLSAQN
jgi:hypothetical protein